MIPTLVIVADDARQRNALKDVGQSCGFEVRHCLPSRQFNDTCLLPSPDLWLIDVEDELALLERIGFDQPVLVGIMAAPAFNDRGAYLGWKRVVSKKLMKLLSNDMPILTQQVDHRRSAYSVRSRPELPPRVLPDVWKVIILAGSMGGLEAIKAFMDKIPPDLPLSFLVTQHIDPYMQNQLPRILSRHNEWVIENIVLRETSIKPGVAYVIPTVQQVGFDAHGTIHLQEGQWPDHYQPSIREVMQRASPVFKHQLLTIVFSGMGDDGSKAAAVQVAAGGKIWAQTAESCASSSQPDQMRLTGHVSFSASPEGLAEQLLTECRQQNRETSREY